MGSRGCRRWQGWRTSAGLMLALMVLVPSAGASQDLPAAPRAVAVQAAQAQAAQPAGEYRRRWAFGFMSGLTNDPKTLAIWHIGGGYEWLVARTLAVSAGAGAMVAGVEGFDWGFPVSANASYYVRQNPVAQRALVPFVSVGYTRGGFSRSSNMFNFGVGFNQWTQGWSGFRFEVRHHISDESGPEGRNWFAGLPAWVCRLEE